MKVFTDYYRLLEVRFGCDSQEIKTSYYRLAKASHPDMKGGNDESFSRLHEAYSVLSDQKARNEYDKKYVIHVRDMLRERQAQKFITLGEARFFYPVKMHTLAERGLLQKKVKRAQRQKHTMLNFDIELQLKASEIGRPVQLEVPVFARVLCPDCRGSNAYCPSCNGRGSQKKTEYFRVIIQEGLQPGKILDIDLSSERPGTLSYFKARQLKILVKLENDEEDQAREISEQSHHT